MPMYEYRCSTCRKRSTFLILRLHNPPAIRCQHCQGTDLQRIMSRFAAPKSEESRLESLADPSKFGNLDENDPQSMARFMKKMGQEMGEYFGDEIDEALEEASEGEEISESRGIE